MSLGDDLSAAEGMFLLGVIVLIGYAGYRGYTGVKGFFDNLFGSSNNPSKGTTNTSLNSGSGSGVPGAGTGIDNPSTMAALAALSNTESSTWGQGQVPPSGTSPAPDPNTGAVTIGW